MSKLFHLSILILLVLGCSSLPKQQISQATQKAVQLMEQGGKEEARNMPADALTAYLQSLHYATLNGDLENQLTAMQGCVRVYHVMGDSAKVRILLSDMQKQILDTSPNYLIYYLQVLNWMYMQAGEYQKVYDFAVDDVRYRPDLSIMLLCDKIQAAAKLSIQDKATLKRLQSLLSKYIRTTKNKQGYRTDIVAQADYSIAFYLAANDNWKAAVKSLDKAIKIDKVSDVYINLADDYLLKGKCLLKLNRPDLAQSNLWLAKTIYAELNLPDQSEQADTLLKGIQITGNHE